MANKRKKRKGRGSLLGKDNQEFNALKVKLARAIPDDEKRKNYVTTLLAELEANFPANSTTFC